MAGAASLGALPPDLDLWDIGADGRVAAAARDGSSLAVFDPSSGRGTRVALGGGRGGVQLQSATQPLPAAIATSVAVAPGVVATLVVSDRKSEVTFYRVK